MLLVVATGGVLVKVTVMLVVASAPTIGAECCKESSIQDLHSADDEKDEEIRARSSNSNSTCSINTTTVDPSDDTITNNTDDFDPMAEYDAVAVYHLVDGAWSKAGVGTLALQRHMETNVHRLVLLQGGLREALLTVRLDGSRRSTKNTNHKGTNRDNTAQCVGWSEQKARGSVRRGQAIFFGVHGTNGQWQQFVVRASLETSYALHNRLTAVAAELKSQQTRPSVRDCRSGCAWPVSCEANRMERGSKTNTSLSSSTLCIRV